MMPGVRLLHSSDVHVDDGHIPRIFAGDPLGGLRRVLDAAQAAGSDLVLLAGDTFEHNRLPDALVGAAALLMQSAALPVVILPGNHDPAAPGSALSRLPPAPNVHVLGVTAADAVVLPALDLEIRGRAHRDHDDMPPLPVPAPRRAAHRVVLAHGHYMPERPAARWQPGWLFTDAELALLDADYVALGHWNRFAQVGPDGAHAYYSGSPDHAGTANLVRLVAGRTRVTRLALA